LSEAEYKLFVEQTIKQLQRKRGHPKVAPLSDDEN